MVGALIAIAAAFAYQRSRFGRQLRATREDPQAAQAGGIDVHRQRLYAFVISGALAGFAGGLLVHELGSITTEQVYLDLTFLTLAMLVVGGVASLWGAVVGALLVSGLDSFLNDAEQGVHIGFRLTLPDGTRLVAIGALMALVLILRPSGITGGREVTLRRRTRAVGGSILSLRLPDACCRSRADRRAARFAQLYAGLVIYGISSSLLVLGGYGLVPWDVLHQGLREQTGIPIGTWSILVGLAVLLLWIPLRERPGVGTVSNAIVIGGTIDVVLWLVPDVHGTAARVACCAAGVLLAGVATGMYIGAGLGPGPRDGLMTGFARRSGCSLRLVRTSSRRRC